MTESNGSAAVLSGGQVGKRLCAGQEFATARICEIILKTRESLGIFILDKSSIKNSSESRSRKIWNAK
jgi:hypothetical protein